MSVKGRSTDPDWTEFQRQRIAGDLALGLSPQAAQAAAEEARLAAGGEGG